MHLLHQCSVLAVLTSSALAYTINWSGSSRCDGTTGRIQDIHDSIYSQMSDTALVSKQDVNIACSNIGSDGVKGEGDWGMCAMLGNSGGNLFSKAKILSMLNYLLQPPDQSKSCGSVPVNYPLLNDSYSQLTVNFVYSTFCSGYCDGNQIPQGEIANNALGYAGGWCTFHFLQYQGNTGDGSLTTLIDPSVAATTYVDLQILDANAIQIGGTWYQESPANQTWDMSSQLPAQFEVDVGAIQSDNVTFGYNGANFISADTSHFTWSSNGDSFVNGFRSGNGGFTC